MRFVPAVACFAFTGLVQAQTLATFTQTERFGVSHPDQPVEFSYSGGKIGASNTRMLGPAGVEVAYQQLSTGNILVRTGLPASRIAAAFSVGQMDPNADTITINLGSLTPYPVTGDVIRCEGSTPPRGAGRGPELFRKKGV